MYAVNYHKPASIEDAVAAIGGADEAKILAGGQTLLPTMKQHLAAPSDVIDIRGIGGMTEIAVRGDTVTIGVQISVLEAVIRPRYSSGTSSAIEELISITRSSTTDTGCISSFTWSITYTRRARRFQHAMPIVDAVAITSVAQIQPSTVTTPLGMAQAYSGHRTRDRSELPDRQPET